MNHERQTKENRQGEMSRYNSNGSYNHECKKYTDGMYLISWTYDRYYSGSRLRFPQSRSRWTDEKGAKRFCKKWNINFEGK